MSRVFQPSKCGRRVRVYRSGDPLYPGSQLLVNKNTHSIDTVMREATHKISPVWGAVRSIHTPNTGTQITSLDQLKKNKSYVAAGSKGFYSVPGGYENIGKSHFVQRKAKYGNKTIHRRVPKDRPTTIMVHSNGTPDKPPVAFSFLPSDSEYSWGNVLVQLSHSINLVEGPVKRLYSLSGHIVRGPTQLVEGGRYVAAGDGQRFKQAEYTLAPAALETNSVPDVRRVTRPVKDRRSRPVRQKNQSSERFTKNKSSRERKTYSPNVKVEVRSDPAESVPEPKTNSRFSMSEGNQSAKSYDPNIRLELREEEDSSTSRFTKNGNLGRYSGNSYYSRNTRNNSTSSSNARNNSSRNSSGKSSGRTSRAKLNSSSKGTSGKYSSKSTFRRSSDESIKSKLGKLDMQSEKSKLTGDHSDGSYETVDEEYNQEDTEKDVNNKLDKVREDIELTTNPDTTEERSRPSTSWLLNQSMNQLKLEQEEIKKHKTSQLDALYNGTEMSLFYPKKHEDSRHLSSSGDSGRGTSASFVFGDSDSIFNAKSRGPTRLTTVDYDEDELGMFRAKSQARYVHGTREIQDSTETNIEMPIDMMEAKEITEEVY